MLVVEHDEDMMRAADHIIDMAPAPACTAGAWPRVISGRCAPEPRFAHRPYLAGHAPNCRVAPRAWQRRLLRVGRPAATTEERDRGLPRWRLFTCVTGVSGSASPPGQRHAVCRRGTHPIHRAHEEPAPHACIEGLEHFDKVINVDQSPIGRTPRSNPATYTGLFTAIRELMAEVPTARERGYGPGRFSFNVAVAAAACQEMAW